MDDGVEALIGLVGAHGNSLELLELAEEVLDQMAPFVHLGVDWQRPGPARMLGDDDLGATLVKIGDDGVAVEGLVGDQRAERDAVDERRHADRIVTMPGRSSKRTKLPSASV